MIILCISETTNFECPYFVGQMLELHLSTEPMEFSELYDLFIFHETHYFAIYRVLMVFIVFFTDYYVAFTVYIIVKVR